jgi:putative MFS transporter
MTGASETFTARLDRVPLNSFHWRLLVVSGIGWLFDAMDVILISFVLTPIGREFSLDPTRIGLIASAGFVGMFIGAAVSGRLADRYGRRLVFTWTLVLFSFGAVLSAVAPSFETLLAARVVAGLGLGGELPVASTLVSEFSPRAQRGRMIVLLESFWAYGTIAAGLIAIAVIPSFGWRWAFAVGAVPALYAAYLRSALPESPRYLAERGRTAEADAVVRRVERASGGALLTLERVAAPARAGRSRIADLFRPDLRRRTAMLWILWFGITFTYYGIFLYVPSLLAARGLSVVRSNEFFFLSTLAQVPGYFSAAWLVERWGRKPTLVAYLLGTAVTAFLFGNSGTGTDAFIWAALLSFFNLGAWGVVYTYSPELYPTAIRATGAGVAAAVGRTGGIIGPFLTPVLVPVFGQSGVFALFMVLLVVTALNVFALAEETRDPRSRLPREPHGIAGQRRGSVDQHARVRRCTQRGVERAARDHGSQRGPDRRIDADAGAVADRGPDVRRRVPGAGTAPRRDHHSRRLHRHVADRGEGEHLAVPVRERGDPPGRRRSAVIPVHLRALRGPRAQAAAGRRRSGHPAPGAGRRHHRRRCRALQDGDDGTVIVVALLRQERHRAGRRVGDRPAVRQ